MLSNIEEVYDFEMQSAGPAAVVTGRFLHIAHHASCQMRTRTS
jgi:hypothetical protein